MTPGFLVLFGLLVLLFAGLIWYFVAFSRRAYLGGRFIQACGTFEKAARLAADLDAINEARLAGALSLHAFTKGKTQ